MTSCVFVVAWACLGVQFEALTIPLNHEEAGVFPAQIDAGSGADIFVLDGYTLAIYSGSAAQFLASIQLENGTSGFDVADVDGDGRSEIIAVCGERIQRYAIPKDGTAATPVELFTLRTWLSEPEMKPSRCVLVVEREGRALLALPREKAVELHALDGSLVASYPVHEKPPDKEDRYSTSSFYTTTVEPSSLGGRDAVERSVQRLIRYEPELPEDLAHTKQPDNPNRTWYGAAFSAARGKVDQWPWFPLRTSGASPERVLFAAEQPPIQEMRIRIWRPMPDEKVPKEKQGNIGRERRYPGTQLDIGQDLPDFNHDGYADLILWRSPMPGMSADSLMRAITAGVWRVDVAVHLFNPEKDRYEPIPAASITCSVPIMRFINYYNPPLECCVLRDLDGDGRTDFACSTGVGRYSVWLYGETGFQEKPDFDGTFSDRISGIEFRSDLEGKGRTSIGIRTKKALYVLKARP